MLSPCDPWPRNEHARILEWAEAVRSEHDTVLIDRSDKGSGYLRRVLEAKLGR